MLGTEQPGLEQSHKNELSVYPTVIARAEFHPDFLSSVTFGKPLLYLFT